MKLDNLFIRLILSTFFKNSLALLQPIQKYLWFLLSVPAISDPKQTVETTASTNWYYNFLGKNL
jgi:hypothetical protein